MSSQSGRRVLVLGGIRSGKSDFAEALVGDVGSVRYVATSVADPTDAEWTARLAAHRDRRPADWATEEIGADPDRLAAVLAQAKPDEALLVDDLGGWLTAGGEPAGLADAVRQCPAVRLIVVSPEVGLSVVPATEVGRAFADRLGGLNRAVADACDSVVLVVAGQPSWLKGGDPRGSLAATSTTTTAGPAPALDARPATAAPAAATVAGESPISMGMHLPLPDERTPDVARNRLGLLDFPGTGLGGLARVVAFAAGTQTRDVPRPWQSVRLLLLHADHEGGFAAGDSPAESARRLAQAQAGEGVLALLAGAAGVTVETVRCTGRAAAVETTDALDQASADAALDYGWQLASAAVDAGTDVLVLGSCGAGAEAAAVAVISLTTSAEPAAQLGRVPAPGGLIDDGAWMARCAAIRDALHRIRLRPRDPRELLAAIGGPDLAVATGVLVGAAARQTPVLIDGPVGVAAGLLARDFGAQTRHWLMLPDTGGYPAVTTGADVLGLTPVVDLRLGVGEGATALAVLPLLRTALTLAATVPAHPAVGAAPSIVDSPTTELPIVPPRG
jgi:adenosyl cobinamide kinase/adenosyl cobinamide phosphate guanylyltransferase/NaMN:DMB phosphoribosyltransferase